MLRLILGWHCIPDEPWVNIMRGMIMRSNHALSILPIIIWSGRGFRNQWRLVMYMVRTRKKRSHLIFLLPQWIPEYDEQDKTRTRSDPTAARAAGRGPINERGAAKPQSETATSTRAGICRNTWTEKLQARTFTHNNSHTIFNESFLIRSKILL